ncbi:MAG: hypothetical protein HY016_04420 [Nitrosomonadales bacterium]|nr:hypothetical protein [Nitrosomonadales bacterium]
MDTTVQPENLEEVLATLPPERRAEIEKLAAKLAKSKDLHRAAEILEKSESLGKTLEDTKFIGELGWLTALSVAIAVIAVA